MRTNKFIASFILAAAPLAASHMVYLKDTGTGLINPQAVTADSEGNAIVAGTIGPGATGTNLIGPRGGPSDVKVVKLSQTGQVLWTTILGGTGGDVATGIAVAPNGQIFLAIESSSPNFPLAVSNSGKVIVASLSATGNNLAFATRLAGAGPSGRIFVDAQSNTYIGGNTIDTTFTQVNTDPQFHSAQNAYYAKLDAAGAVAFAGIRPFSVMTDFGAGPAGFVILKGCNIDSINGIGQFVAFGAPGCNGKKVAMDQSGAAYILVIETNGSAFVVKRAVNGAVFSQVYNRGVGHVIGGGGDDIAVNSAGEALIALRTTNNNVTPLNPIPEVLATASDNVLIKLDAAGFNPTLQTFVGLPAGSQARSLFVNSKGIYFAVDGSHAVRVMEHAADMTVTGVSRVKSGLVSRITVRVVNNGPEAVSTSSFQASISGILPRITSSQGSCWFTAPGNAVCSLGALASGAFVNVTLSTIAPSSGNLDPLPVAGSNVPDPNTANDFISFPFLP